MARATSPKRLADPERPVDALTVIEQYAQEDIVRNSDRFLEIVERVVSQWGSAIEERVTRFVMRSTDITDAPTAQQVQLWMKDAAELERENTVFFKPRKSLFDRVHSVICAREKTVAGELPAWRKRANDNLIAYEREQQRLRREEEQRRAEAAQREEQERLLRESELLKAQGHEALADQALEEAATVTAPVITIAPATAREKGISIAANWKGQPIGGWTPENCLRALKYIPRDQLHLFVELKPAKVDAFARMHQGAVKVPGLEFYDAGKVTVRT